MRRAVTRCILALAAVILVASVPLSAQSFDRLRLIAPAAPGGGWDQTARVMQQVLQKAGIVRTASVENVTGAAGLIGLARFIGAEHGRDDVLMVNGLIMLGAIVTQHSAVSFADVTPIARLTGEYEVLAVPLNSPFQSLGDFIAAFKNNPEAISWGGGSAGGSDQILAGLIAKAVGVTPSRVNYIAFSGGGEALSAILGGQVSVGINGLAEFASQVEGGTVRVLGISSGQRLSGLEVPTLREQGVDVEFENWRSVVAPPGIDARTRQRYDAAVRDMVRSAPWQDALKQYRWIDRYLAGRPFEEFVDAEEIRVAGILRELGTSRTTPSGPGAYPLFVLAVLALCLTVTVAGIVRAHRSSFGVTAWNLWQSTTWIVAGIAANLVLIERAGFVIAAAALFWCTARAFDARHPMRDLIVGAALSVAAYVLFGRVLSLPLPAGVLASWS